ncbi:MAG TPA: hypothetical protein DCF63_05050, partial [Planctomycetaceae bacterium]|nr:hypothetical protein [Planctomycetaceae bacterium]
MNNLSSPGNSPVLTAATPVTTLRVVGASNLPWPEHDVDQEADQEPTGAPSHVGAILEARGVSKTDRKGRNEIPVL